MVVILADWRTMMHFCFTADPDKSEVYNVEGIDDFYLGVLQHPMSTKDHLI